MNVILRIISTICFFWVLKKNYKVVRKRASQFLKKLFFFVIFFLSLFKTPYIRPQTAQILRKIIAFFFHFNFLIKLHPCGRHQSKSFFHENLSLQGALNGKYFPKFDHILKVFVALEIKAASVGTKSEPSLNFFTFFFSRVFNILDLESQTIFPFFIENLSKTHTKKVVFSAYIPKLASIFLKNWGEI